MFYCNNLIFSLIVKLGELFDCLNGGLFVWDRLIIWEEFGVGTLFGVLKLYGCLMKASFFLKSIIILQSGQNLVYIV